MRKSLRSKRDEEAFELFAQKLDELILLEEKGELDLYFEDESWFNLIPCIPYGWQKETIEIPSTKSKSIKILAFLSRQGIVKGFEVEGQVNGEVFLEALERFAKTLTKRTLVVLDNASIHTCELVKNELERLKNEYQLECLFLPPYSPELNLIERFWRKMKYEWIPINAYQSFESLKQAVYSIFEQYESKYQINFG